MEPIVFIPLTQGKVAVIDFADFEKVRPHKWHAVFDREKWYAARKFRDSVGEWKNERMHVFLCPRIGPIDHRDLDGLNNRRDNLRAATKSQNAANSRKRKNCSSQYKGVVWHKAAKKWLAQIRHCHKNIYLGLFDDESDAAKAYDTVAKQLHKTFARLNFS